jgi:hypothetical protein
MISRNYTLLCKPHKKTWLNSKQIIFVETDEIKRREETASGIKDQSSQVNPFFSGKWYYLKKGAKTLYSISIVITLSYLNIIMIDLRTFFTLFKND